MLSYIYENIVLINSVVILAMGIIILRKNPRNKLNILFFVKCLLISANIFMAIPEMMAARESILFFYKIRMCLATGVILVFLLFYIEIVVPKTGKWIKAAAFFPALICALILISLDNSDLNLIQFGNFTKLIPSYGDAPFRFLFLYLLLYGFSSSILLFKWYRNAGSNKEKKQARIILIAGTLFLASILITDNVLAHLHIPYLASPLFSLYIGAIFYAFVKYRFLTFSKKDVAQEIFSHVQDMILIFNPDLTLMDANENCRKRFQGNGNKLSRKAINKMIIDDGKILIKFKNMISGETQSFNGRIVFKTEPENIITDSYVSRITDKFNDFVAVLIVAKENQGILHLKKLFNITGRQLQIIQMIIDGSSNEEICEKLSLARRTVETHLSHIYEKLSVKNRIELVRLANEYNILTKNKN